MVFIWEVYSFSICFVEADHFSVLICHSGSVFLPWSAWTVISIHYRPELLCWEWYICMKKTVVHWCLHDYILFLKMSGYSHQKLSLESKLLHMLLCSIYLMYELWFNATLLVCIFILLFLMILSQTLTTAHTHTHSYVVRERNLVHSLGR